MTKKNRTPLPGSESFESLGKTWHLAPIGPRITEAYAAWCRMAARRNISRDKHLLRGGEYEEDQMRLRRMIDAGDYDWGPPPEMQGTGMGEGCLAIFRSETGKTQLLRLLLEPAHGELSDEEVGAIVEGDSEAVSAAFNAVFFSRYPWLQRPPATTEPTPASTATEGGDSSTLTPTSTSDATRG